MKINLVPKLRLLPILVIVALLSFSVRLGDFYAGLKAINEAQAAQESKPDKDAPQAMEEAGGVIVVGDSEDFEGIEEEPDILSEDNVLTDWVDPVEDQIDFSDVQVGLYKDLSKRRKIIEKREQELLMREALLEAAEREIEQKMRELSAVHDEIKKMMEKQENQDTARMQSLVKIYEGMKAKDAARIFNTLDLDVLVTVLTKMSERKSAPIIAAMSAERARTVTLLLAQQRKMPMMQ
jgi:flagellar motility protein MotE (MotC chaperone)